MNDLRNFFLLSFNFLSQGLNNIIELKLITKKECIPT